MDKDRRKMRDRQAVLVCVFSAILLLCCGCGTVKGVGQGVSSLADGMYQDARGTCNFIQAADRWIKKNLW
jgi:predicted small secreted protein